MPPLDAALIILLLLITVAGVARGLSGFGTGMLVAPVAGALYGPKAALAIIVLIDFLPTVPVTLPALRIARWSEVLPVMLGVTTLYPAGVYLLVTGDPLLLRWVIALAILGCVAVLYTGWRYKGPRNVATSLGVGGVAGVLSGIASIPGPPVIAYWMASGLPAAIVRANLLTLFFLGGFVSLANLWLAGLFGREVVVTALVAAPLYFAGIMVGWRLFNLASERLPVNYSRPHHGRSAPGPAGLRRRVCTSGASATAGWINPCLQISAVGKRCLQQRYLV